jgi:murein DD-endopeptidase MepM/ murein hydrolase activator NlpD
MDNTLVKKSFRNLTGILLVSAVLIVFIAPATTSAQSDFSLPFEVGPTIVSSGPGDGGFHSHGSSSEAIDFDLPSGTTIYPTKPGVVKEVAYGWNDGYGNFIEILHHDGTTSLYGHLSRIFVVKMQEVGYTTELGEVGNSGNVSPPPSPGCPTCGDFLHFEVRTPDQKVGINVQHLVEWVAGCPGCADQIKGTAGGDPRQLFLLDSFLYNSSERSATSTLVLDAGRTYLLTVTGTFSFWSPGQWGNWLGDNAERICWGIAEEGPLIPSPGDRTGSVGADPEYRFAIPLYPGGCEEGPLVPRRGTGIQFNINAGEVYDYLPPTNEEFNFKHSYQYLAGGNGQPLLITILDSTFHDNYGQLEVTIEPYR